jgi:hypothetical protein
LLAFFLPLGAGASEARSVINSLQVPAAASIVRTDLTAEELARDQPASIALRLRNFAELDARVQRGEIISGEEMVARYYPTHETWAASAAWATSWASPCRRRTSPT